MWWLIVASWYAAWSIACAGAMWLDKRKARAGAWRVKERTLHTFELFGGWPGSFAAMKWVRHKNRKASFWGVTVAIAVLHVAGWGVGLWLTGAI